MKAMNKLTQLIRTATTNGTYHFANGKRISAAKYREIGDSAARIASFHAVRLANGYRYYCAAYQ